MGAQPGGAGSTRTPGRWTGWDTVAGNTPVGAGSQARERWLGIGRSVRNKGPRGVVGRKTAEVMSPPISSRSPSQRASWGDRHSRVLQLGQKRWEKPREPRRLASPPAKLGLEERGLRLGVWGVSHSA